MNKISKRAGNVKQLFKGKFLTINLLDDWYEFIHDGNGKFVAVLGYRRLGKDYWEYLGRFENCPPHQDGISLCCLTGGIENDELPLDAAKRELKEESGIDIETKMFKSLGEVRPSKMSDSTGYLFAVDLSHIAEQDKYVGGGDGTKGEMGSFCKWVDKEKAFNSKDPLLITCISRLGF